jgi:carnitine 3-dehydrogenase
MDNHFNRTAPLGASVLINERWYNTVETYIMHRAEAKLGDELHIETQLLSFDDKRVHIFHRLRRGDTEIASAEQMLLHVDTKAGKAASTNNTVWNSLANIAQVQKNMPFPTAVGRRG